MQPMDIAIRAYVCRKKPVVPATPSEKPKKKYTQKKSDMPSEWALILDAETTTDASQKLRFGTYQVRKGAELMESGVFYDPETLTKAEQKTLKKYAPDNGLKFFTATEFIEDVFYYVGYKLRASIVGFNLPFDISRLAVDHTVARVTPWNKLMQGGFSFKLSENVNNPRVQIRHVSSRQSFIQFAATRGQRTTKGNRKKGRYERVRRGYFLDIKTLAAALTSTSHSLASLAQYLNVNAQKHHTESHGMTLTPEYIAYAVQDTQTTWECFDKLNDLYLLHDLHDTGAHKILSEASLGKAYLREMGVRSWRQMQPDFPPEIIGNIMSTYYGGRSEVHIRRDAVQVLYCDFLSMYPTVCTLMGLWRFVTAQGMIRHDSTIETRAFLENVTLSQLQQPSAWDNLCTIVQIMPDSDILPVRAKYGDDAQYTIGSNHLTSKTPLWFTLADCISSKLLTGRAPKILQAVSFTAGEMQQGLTPVNISGEAAYRVDPCSDDFFKQIIDLRTKIKKQLKVALDAEKSTLDKQQLALKILANATSYGIFVELNVEEEKELQPMLCYGASGKAIPIKQKKFEGAGSYFHPLLATLITGAARLMLAITERTACDAGLDWAFCDTDSMALAKPETMLEAEFYKKAQKIADWFTPLNPYADKAPLLKIEDYNYSLSDDRTLQSLYCFAISSKRYALFNIGADGMPILRKVSAHGLGHLVAPYHRDGAALDDVQPWQQDFWLEIIKAALSGNAAQPNFEQLPNIHTSAVSRYGATTPQLERWFAAHNADKAYPDRVRPFNFLLAMQAKPQLKAIKPVAPYNKNPSKSLVHCFDRATGESVSKNQLKTYLDGLAQYHLHPETKFLNGDYLDTGKTQRRHMVVNAIQHIGKEANKWEEQFYTGIDDEAQIEYGISLDDRNAMLQAVLDAISKHGNKAIATASHVSSRHVLKIQCGQSHPTDATLAKLYAAARRLEVQTASAQAMLAQAKAMIASKSISISGLAKKLGVDAANLAKVLAGNRAANNDLITNMSLSMIRHDHTP